VDNLLDLFAQPEQPQSIQLPSKKKISPKPSSKADIAKSAKDTPFRPIAPDGTEPVGRLCAQSPPRSMLARHISAVSAKAPDEGLASGQVGNIPGWQR